MAGSWPDCPSRKIAYHDDGTVVAGRYPVEGAPYENFYEWSVANLNELNDLDFVSISGSWPDAFPAMSYVNDILVRKVDTVWIFPELRDLYGMVMTAHEAGTGTGGSYVDIYISGDTTNGIDGTWTYMFRWHTDTNMLVSPDPEDWRTAIVSFDFPSARAVKASGFGNVFSATPLLWRSAFIFGTISAGETPDRILFVDDSTGLEFTKPMDWGDVPRGTTLDWDIYLLNNSSTLDAGGTMVLDFTTLYNSSDTWLTISDSGGAFGATADVPTMVAGARYPAADVFTVRLIVPDDEPLGIYEAILELSPASSWT